MVVVCDTKKDQQDNVQFFDGANPEKILANIFLRTLQDNYAEYEGLEDLRGRVLKAFLSDKWKDFSEER